MSKSSIWTAVGAMALMIASITTPADAQDSRIRIGRDIAPVPLDLAGTNRGLVWLGSYIVNAQGGCNDCHTSPPFVEGGNPFEGEPEQINADEYLCGGTPFGPIIISADISPDQDGLPAGLLLEEFIDRLRTGEKGDGTLLQVMPWPVFGKMTRHDLSAIYEYLSAIPSCDD